MNKKRILIAAVVAAAAALSCVGNNGDSPVQILGAFSVDQECNISTDIQRFGASYDLAGARLQPNGASFADVLATFQLKSEFGSTTTKAEGQTLSDESRNGAYMDQVQLSYRSTPSIGFEAETYSLHGYIDPGGILNGVTDLLGPKAAQKLLQSVAPGGEAIEVIVSLRFRGYTAGSSGATFTTNEIEFPIRFYDSGLKCPGGPSFDGPCGALTGQNGASCASFDAGLPAGNPDAGDGG